MADFALWAAACETFLQPPGTFGRAYEANRRAAIEGIIDADPVAACVREIMAERSSWTGTAADILRAGAEATSAAVPRFSLEACATGCKAYRRRGDYITPPAPGRPDRSRAESGACQEGN